VTDPQIDVLSPESHVIRFAIVDGPSHGALVGDLDAVLYEPPSDALVVLSYVPATGYVGSDAFSVRASDPSQADVVLRVAVDVGQSVAGGMLGGHSQWTATIDVPATTMTSMSWVADVSYTVLATTIEPGFAFKLEGADPAFDDFYVSVTTPFGVLGTASLRLDFNPDPLSDLFDYAAATLAVRLGGASIAASFHADGTQTGSRASLQFSGVTPDDELSLSARVTLASCAPTFESATATVRLSGFDCGPAAECAFSVSGTAGFTCDGFEKLTVLAEGIDLPSVGWLNLATSASVLITYDVQTKSLSISPRFASLVVDCFSFGTEFEWANNSLLDVRLTSFHVDHTFANGVRLRMDTSLDPTDLTLNQDVTGFLDYWEADVLSGNFAICEGIGGDWEVGVYFARPGVGVQLFDWGMLELKATVTCGRLWELFTEFTFRSGVFGDPTSEWLLGAELWW